MWGYDEYQFNYSNNYFTNLLSLRFDIVLTDANPDLLIYSCFGDRHKDYKCTKIFFTGENTNPPSVKRTIYPDYSECHYSLSFFPDSDKNKYLPLWVLFINWFCDVNPQPLPSNPTFKINPIDLIADSNRYNRAQQLFRDKKFCAFINNNPIADRVSLFHSLNSRERVDSFGKLLNNTGSVLRGSEESKLNLLVDYKSTIAYENSYRMGYNTEKVIHPYSAFCIPIYSGGLDRSIFNSSSMFFLDDYPDYYSMVEDILTVSSSIELWAAKVSQPLFTGNMFPESLLPLNVLKFIIKALNNEQC